MNRRSFIDRMGLGSLSLAAASAGISQNTAGGTLERNQEKKLRFPQDLEKYAGSPEMLKKPEDLTVACYTFPDYHPSAIHDKLYAPGWTEYNLVRSARPWFPGHQQPRGPLLGEADERKPSTWGRYNKLAHQQGIDVFIWDWYWYDNQPVLHEALEEGFLQSSNRNEMKFACMWTNHPWIILYPTLRTDGVSQYPPSYAPPDKDLKTCWESLTYIISRYFNYPNYWRIDDNPVLCIWNPELLEQNIGLSAIKKLFGDLRNFAKNLGYKDIHFHASAYNSTHLKEAGYNTAGSYNDLNEAASRYQPKEKEICDYEVAIGDVVSKIWEEKHDRFDVPFIPNVSVGWDSTPRYINPRKKPEKPNRDIWPQCTIFDNENPAAFKSFVQAAFPYLNKHPEVPKIFTIACWNEWTEGHYLLPDNRFGYGMLDALAEALGIEGTMNMHGI